MPSNAVVLNGQIGFPSNRQLLAGAGAYFTVTEPTLGTGVAYALQTATSATANGLFAISNGNASGGKSIYLDRLSLTETATAPTGTLRMTLEVINETGIVTLTGNVATRTPIQVNTGLPQTTGATVQAFSAGAATVPAAVGTRRNQAEIHIDTGVCVVHDTYAVDFGADGPQGWKNGGAAARATDQACIVASGPPIVIAPQTTSWINMYWVTAAANTPSFTYLLSYFEL